MDLQEQMQMCSFHYGKWKNLAIEAKDKEELKKCIDRASFWIELQSAFVALWAIEKDAKDQETKRKIIAAKANLSKRLADYASKILEDIDFTTSDRGSKL